VFATNSLRRSCQRDPPSTSSPSSIHTVRRRRAVRNIHLDFRPVARPKLTAVAAVREIYLDFKPDTSSKLSAVVAAIRDIHL
jgi:hypothetical protein